MGLRNHRVLITGGAGFIGSHLSRSLTESGAEVEILDDLSNGRSEYVPAGANLHEHDIRDKEVGTLLKDIEPTVIVHLAAHHYIPYCNEHPEETFEVNIMGTRTLLDAARDIPTLDQVIYASSAAVYPVEDGPFHESDPTGPTDIYGRTKLVGEDLCRFFQEDTGVPTAVTRLFNVFGRNETNEHVIPAIFSQLHDGNRDIELGNLVPKRDFVHVSDVRRAFETLITEFGDGYRVYNIGTGTEHSVEELVEHVSRALGENIRIAQGSHRVREDDRLHLCADASRAEDELDWSSTVSLEDGLRDLLAESGIIDQDSEEARL